MKRLFVILIAFSFPASIVSLANDEYIVLTEGKIAPGEEFGVGVDDSAQRRNWLFEAADSIEVRYPGKLGWGAVFITVDDAKDPPRPSADFSDYDTLHVEMRGDAGGECLRVGIKDYNDPDNGREPKMAVVLGSEWETYSFDIENDFADPRAKNRYSPLDLTRLYVLAEFVFPCRGKNRAQTVHIKNVRFSR